MDTGSDGSLKRAKWVRIRGRDYTDPGDLDLEAQCVGFRGRNVLVEMAQRRNVLVGTFRMCNV